MKKSTPDTKRLSWLIKQGLMIDRGARFPDGFHKDFLRLHFNGTKNISRKDIDRAIFIDKYK